MEKVIKNISKVLLTVLISFSAVNVLSIDISSYTEFDIDAVTTYDDTKETANIQLLADQVNEGYLIQKIEDPEGKVMDLSNPTYSVKENGTYEFKVIYQEKITEENEIAEDKEYVKKVVVDGIGKIKEEKTSTITPRTITTPSGQDSLSVKFKRDSGSDIDWTDETQIDWNYYDRELVEIVATFSGKGTSKTRIIEIDIPDGYEVIGYAAKDGTPSQAGETILGTVGSVQDAMVKSELTSQNGGAFGSESIIGYKTGSNAQYSEVKKSGKIYYEFNTEADTITLNLRLGIQRSLYSYEDAKELFSDALGTTSLGISNGQLKNDLKVTMTTGSEELTETIKANVKKTVASLYYHRGTVSQNVTTTYIDGDNYSPVINPYGPDGLIYINAGSYGYNMLFEEVSVEYSYPEGASYEGFADKGMSISGNAIINHDALNRKITVTYTNIQTTGNMHLGVHSLN